MEEEYSVKKGNKNPLPKMESRGGFYLYCLWFS